MIKHTIVIVSTDTPNNLQVKSELSYENLMLCGDTEGMIKNVVNHHTISLRVKSGWGGQIMKKQTSND